MPKIAGWLGVALCAAFGLTAVLAAPVALPLGFACVACAIAFCLWAVVSVSQDPDSPASREARKVAERRSSIVTAASHEIRNPLTMISAAVRLMNEAQNEDDRVKFALVIQQQTDQAISIADDLLIQSRIDAGKFSLNRTETDLGKLVRDVVEAMRPIALHRSQTLFVDIPLYLPLVRVDPRAVRQALSNLLMNAVRHTGEGRMITVRVRDNANAVVLMVLDDGDGMSKEERRRLFEPFESGDLLGDGTGLGLNITRQLVEAHGGRILVDTRLHEGTAIMITLPRTP